MKTYNSFICILFLILACACDKKQDKDAFSGIDIEEGLKNFHQSNLSDYASDIRYVRLQTNENYLVARDIYNVYLVDNKIFVYDSDPYLKVFDAETGKYLYNVGAKGQGPDELPHLSNVDINEAENTILLSGGYRTNRFDLKGNFEKAVNTSQIKTDTTESIGYAVALMDEDVYAGGIKSYSNNQINAAVLFDEKLQIINILKSYEDYPPPPIPIQVWSPFDEMGVFFRDPTSSYYFRGISDTIFAYNSQQKTLLPYVHINYGKHRSYNKRHYSEENKDLIKLSSITKSNEHFFLEFHTENASPEPFEDVIYRSNQKQVFVNKSIWGIYEIKNQKIHFLLQPIPKHIGLKNDIDGGVPFWPRNVSSKNEMIDYHQAYKFIESFQKLPNPSPALKKMVQEMTEEDNPIVIIATPLSAK